MTYSKAIKITLFVPIILALLYIVMAYGDVPGLSNLRDLWIETAMTTADHQWLATRLFPKSVVARVMSGKLEQTDIISDPERIDIEGNGTFDDYPDSVRDSTYYYGTPDALPAVGDDDNFGGTVVVSDADEYIVISEVKTVTYTGYVAQVIDPSRVAVAWATQLGEHGQIIAQITKNYDSVLSINANGFDDPNGNGNGGTIIGWTVSNHAVFGDLSVGKDKYTSIAFTDDNKVIVGNLSEFDSNIRDLVQYGPAVIVDGVKQFATSAGYGMHPRTAVGQRRDGTIILAVFDGRQPGHSLGINIVELTEVMERYGAFNAACCDGGSSATMYYRDRLINSVSAKSKEIGRYLPNAVIVRPRNADGG